MKHRHARYLLLGIVIAASIVPFLFPAIPQDASYHRFADARTLWGVSDFWNVASNVPFVIVGLLGLRRLALGMPRGGLPQLRAAYIVFFVGIATTGIGSGFYHWHPTNDSLVWDRLPMTLAFMAFLSIVVGEYIDPSLGKRLLIPSVLLGLFSVIEWIVTEHRGYGDLRLYIVVQFAPMLLIPLTMWLFPSRLSKPIYLWGLLGAYGISKLLEWLDAPIFALTHGNISGHTLKHFAAGGGTWLMYLALMRRVALQTETGTTERPIENIVL